MLGGSAMPKKIGSSKTRTPTERSGTNPPAPKSSKIFGIYTHCQMGEDEIRGVTESYKVLLLLQIGEAGFNPDGVFSVLIPQKDLLARDFSHCEFAWGKPDLIGPRFLTRL